jgi:hypothetical protein
MNTEQINVEIEKIYAASTTYTESIIIYIFKEKVNNNKYISFTVWNTYAITHLYKEPDVNPKIYKILEIIQKKGDTEIKTDGSVWGPDLIEDTYHKIYELVDSRKDTFIMKDDIVSGNVKIEKEELFDQIILNNI